MIVHARRIPCPQWVCLVAGVQVSYLWCVGRRVSGHFWLQSNLETVLHSTDSPEVLSAVGRHRVNVTCAYVNVNVSNMHCAAPRGGLHGTPSHSVSHNLLRASLALLVSYKFVL